MRLKLSHKLTLIIGSVLGLVLLAALATTYEIVSNAESITAAQSLANVVGQLAGSIDVQIRRQGAALRVLGSDTVVQQLLLANPVDETRARAAIRHRLPLDSTTTLRIWTGDGSEPLAASGGGVAESAEPLGALPRRDDSTRFGPLYLQGDAAMYWVVSPIITPAGRRIGWVGERRPIASSAEERRGIQGFLGGDVAVYFRNDSGSFWADLAGHAIPGQPGTRFSNGMARYRRPDQSGDVLAADADIRNTPWSLVLERPRSAAIAASRASVLRLAGFGLLLLVAAIAAVWLISHQFAEPVMDVARAARSMSAGEYHARVNDRLASRSDEIGQLARSFNDMAAEVHAVHSELEQQVEEAQSLNEELEDAVRQADDANQAKSRFVTRMSHELRTPLNAIAGYTELLEMGIHGAVTDEQRDALQRIRRSERTLLSLIDDVLGHAGLEAGQMRYSIAPVRVRVVIEASHTLVAPQLASKALRFDMRACDSAVVARADSEKMRRIVTNLLSNAIKFTEPHGTISVGCRVVDDRVSIEVRDTGIGIPADRLDIIFEPFVQLRDDLTRTAEGTGLGLAISRELARGMGGDLTVASEEGRGSVFTLVLPREASAVKLESSGTA